MRIRDLLYAMLVASEVWVGCGRSTGQTQTACGNNGYRVIASRWDAVLRVNWEVRQGCAHPEWPAHVVVSGVSVSLPPGGPLLVAVPAIQPVLVRAGDRVRLWAQDETVRIEMSGLAEGPARMGERVTIQITRQADDEGLIVERIAGVVRGTGDVEMER